MQPQTSYDMTPEVRAGLQRLRRRRAFFWAGIIVYIPLIWASLQITGSDRATAWVFGVWLVYVAIAANITAFSKCPNCGYLYHINGVVPMYLRRCLHCGLPLNADKKGR